MVRVANMLCGAFGTGGDTESLLGDRAEQPQARLDIPCVFFCRRCLDEADPQNLFHLEKAHRLQREFDQQLPDTCERYLGVPERSHMFRRMLAGTDDYVRYPTTYELSKVTREDIPRYCDEWIFPTYGEPIKSRFGAVGAKGAPDVPPFDMVIAKHKEGIMPPHKTGRSYWDDYQVQHFIQYPLYAIYDLRHFAAYWPTYLHDQWKAWCCSDPEETRLIPVVRLAARETLTPLGREAVQKLGEFMLGRMNRVGASHFAEGEDTLGSPTDHGFPLLKGKAGTPRATTVQSDAVAGLILAILQRELWDLYRAVLASHDPEDFPVAYLMRDMMAYLTAVELADGKRRGRNRSPFPWREGHVFREIWMGTRAWVAAYAAAGGREDLAEKDDIIAFHEANMFGLKNDLDGEIQAGMILQILLGTWSR